MTNNRLSSKQQKLKKHHTTTVVHPKEKINYKKTKLDPPIQQLSLTNTDNPSVYIFIFRIKHLTLMVFVNCQNISLSKQPFIIYGVKEKEISENYKNIAQIFRAPSYLTHTNI